MTVRIAAALAALSTFVASQAPQAADRDIPITSAILRIERRAVDGVVLHVDNLRDAPLQAWLVTIGSGSTLFFDRSDQRVPYGRGDGPIARHEVRAIKLDAYSSRPAPASASLTLAVFEDGWLEGTKANVEAWTSARRQWASDAEYWLNALDRARGKTDAEARGLLRAALVARRQEIAEMPTFEPREPFDAFYAPGDTIGLVASDVDDQADRPPGWFDDAVSAPRAVCGRLRLLDRGARRGALEATSGGS